MSNLNSINSSYPFATTDYTNNSVTYAKIQTVSSLKLIGNLTASTANASEVGVSSNTALTSATINIPSDLFSYTYFGGL
jgi:hypothetical protein